MKKKSLMLLFCIPFAFALGGFAACEEEACEHTYADTLSSDAEYHWYAATCEHTDVKGEQEPHKDENDDGVCDICAYDGDHVHTYEETLTISQTHHWYATTCTHDVPKDKAEHVDDNNDGRCDVCLFDKGHVCTYETAWSTNATKHWHATTCSHAPVMEDHVDSDGNNVCDVCEYDYFALDEVVAAATSANKAALVNGGTINVTMDGDPSGSYAYAFGDGYTYTKEQYGNYHYSYVTADGIDPVFVALQQTVVGDDDLVNTEDTEVDTVVRDLGKSSDSMVGLKISGGYLPDDYNGVEALISSLYAFGKAASGRYCYVDGYNATTKEYSFQYFDSTADGRMYTVKYTLSESGAIDSAVVTLEQYYSSSWLANNATKQIVFAESATPHAVVEYTIDQTIGARTATNPYANLIEEKLIDELAFVDEEGEAVGTTAITVNPSIEYVFPLAGDLQDDYAFNQFDIVKYKKVNGEWEEDNSLDQYAQYRTPADGETKACIKFKAYKEGEYKLVVSTELCEKELIFNCVYADPTAITTALNVEGYETEASSTTVYKGVEVNIIARVNAGAESGKHNATVTSGQTETTDYTITQSGNDYYFTAKNAGTYVIKIASTVSGFESTVYTEFTVVANEPPTPAEILTGKFRYQTSNMNRDIIDIIAEFNNGTVTITQTVESYWTGDTTESSETMTYTANDAYEITLTHTEGDELGYAFYINNYELYIDTYGYGLMSAQPMTPWGGELFGWNESIMYRLVNSTASPMSRYLVTLNVDGTGSYKVQEFVNLSWTTTVEATFTYTLTEATGGYTVAFTLDAGVTCEEFDASAGGTLTFNTTDGVEASSIKITINDVETEINYYDPNA